MSLLAADGFSLIRWAAWAPGLAQPDDWLRWSQAPFCPTGDDMPAALHLPALLKRRTQRLGRMALEVLARVQENHSANTPIIFASRHGETLRSLSLMRELASEGSVSPQTFSLSVHNATIGIHTIAGGSHANVTALTGGMASGRALLTEASGLLHDGAATVIIVACDDTLPDCYHPYLDEPSAAFAWAAELAPGNDLNLSAVLSSPPQAVLPNLLNTLHGLLCAMPHRPLEAAC